MELTIQLRRPHAKQAALRRSPAKRKVICSGRRSGKTTGCAIVAVEAMLAGRRVLQAAPTADQTTAFWEECKRALAEPIMAGIVRKNETERLLEIAGKGRIRAKTAWNADTLRGDYADLLILDEYALIEPSAWDQVGAPMLLDNDGDAIFISTPRRKNHFYSLYVRALGDTSARWRAWHFTSYDNPHLSGDALAKITADMTEEAYKQEILAEFLDNEGAVFRNLAACMHAPMDATPGDHAGHTLVMGCDWGRQQDYTCLSVVCRDCHLEVARDRMNVHDYYVQRQSLISLALPWHVAVIVPEENSMGAPIIAQLARDPELEGVEIRPFTTTASSKPPLIESLRLAFEREECQWQDDAVWTAELEAYEVTYAARTGRPSYGAPAGVHDDTVMARALAWSAVCAPLGVGFAPSLYADPPEDVTMPRERLASEHNGSELHRRWAQKHFCQQCHDEWLALQGGER